MKKVKNSITLEEVYEATKYIFENSVKDIDTDRRVIIMFRFCQENGWVKESSNDPFLILCDNKNCDSCRDMSNLIKKYVNDQGKIQGD